MSGVEVTLYSRKNCALCDEAKSAIGEAAAQFGIRVAMHEVDIDRDPALRAQFTNDVPVIYVNGHVAFRHRVDPGEFAAYVRRHVAPPVNNARALLADEKCIPCRGGVPPLKGEELAAVQRELGGGWNVVSEHHLEKQFPFPDFA